MSFSDTCAKDRRLNSSASTSECACVSDDAAIQIAGADRDITTGGALYDADELSSLFDAQPQTEYRTGTDVLVQAPV
ncbi:hypothetical protein [Corynebacterium xerosis]|uniref:hypothetical protein n=1 Tax=Corynebacterium xerosis TaxID=1725 RepID=UPI00387A5A08